MSDWNKFKAVLANKNDDEYHFVVFVWGVTKETALEKLVAEYPEKKYTVVSFEPTIEDPLSDPNSFKGPK